MSGDRVEVGVIDSLSHEMLVCRTQISARIFFGPAERHGHEGFLQGPQAIHVDVLEEVLEMIVVQYLVVEEVYRGIDRILAAEPLVEAVV